MQFNSLAESYLAERANYKYSTLKSYRSILDAHLLPAFGGKEIQDITSGDIRLFQVSLSMKVTGSRVNTICQLLRCILHDAHRSNVITLDPTNAVRKVRQAKTKVEPFTDAELEAIFAAVDPFFLPYFQTLLFTGMRPNEAFALTWNDLDFETKSINIDKGSVEGRLGTTKTECSERVVPMVDALVPILEALPRTSSNVFVNKEGSTITGDMDRIWKRACAKANVKYRVPYTLRHTAATRALMRGVPIAYLAKILGHSTMATTLRYYARWTNSVEHENTFRSIMG